MIEVPIEISKLLRAMAPQEIGGRAIFDSKSVYDQDGDFRAFVVIQRAESERLTVFHFDISDLGVILREDFVIATSPNLTKFDLIDHEVFKSDDAVCGMLGFSHLETMEVDGKSADLKQGPTLLYPAEALSELETVIKNAWKHQKSQGRFTGAG